ncbi:MAG TPA: DUF4390 domain-containing protein [Steroidobacteraceae bacterium]|nr:DUF4390 domain-containing protein [Steroidobacteraceae bacterium]
MQFRRANNLLSLLLCALAALAACGLGGVARADPLDGLLEVRSAYVNVDQGVFQLFARIAYPVNDDIRAALKDGLMLTFDLDVVVSRERRFWMDETVAEYTLKRELIYHAVSDRYVTRDRDSRSSEQRSYATLDEALEELGTVEAWPFLLSPQLSANRQYRVSLRAGVRRGRLPDTLRVLLFWTDDWHRESEWFSWSLQR